jgi:hypothetical protein
MKDGWDAAVKISALVAIPFFSRLAFCTLFCFSQVIISLSNLYLLQATVFMGKKLLPSQVERVSIQNVTLEDVKKAKENGGRLKVMCEAESFDNLTKVCTMNSNSSSNQIL